MRTTVEMKPEHRSALLSMASRRGQKGFSAVLSEAIESYLRQEQDRRKLRDRILALRGSLSAESGEKLRRTARSLREHWR
jgi:hypothetical protein